MADELLLSLFRDWRFQCEERKRQWAQQHAVPEWHLNVHEALQLLDEIDVLNTKVDKVERERDDAVSHAKKLNKAFSESWTARLGIAAQRVCSTPPGDWEVSVNGEAFNALDVALRNHEEDAAE